MSPDIASAELFANPGEAHVEIRANQLLRIVSIWGKMGGAGAPVGNAAAA
jgi:hypothetical protein